MRTEEVQASEGRMTSESDRPVLTLLTAGE